MIVFSVYYTATGLFLDRRCEGSIDTVTDMMPLLPDCSFILGEYDHLSQRVDLETGEVVDYRPDQPSPRHEWDADAKRWVYVPGDAELLYHAQQAALSAVNDACAATLAGVRYSYPADEVTSWAKQEAEARAWLADNATPAPLIGALSAARGVPLGILAQKIVDKADAFAAESGRIIGQRQAREDAIEAAATVADVRAVLAEAFPDDPHIDYVLTYKP